jgi:hypothetical protein
VILLLRPRHGALQRSVQELIFAHESRYLCFKTQLKRVSTHDWDNYISQHHFQDNKSTRHKQKQQTITHVVNTNHIIFCKWLATSIEYNENNKSPSVGYNIEL